MGVEAEPFGALVALGVDDDHGWEVGYAVGVGGGFVRVEGYSLHGVGAREGGYHGGRLADVDGDHVDFGVLAGKALDQGDRLLARLAPGCPEV